MSVHETQTTRRTTNTRRLLIGLTLFLSAGCFRLARPTPPLEEYVLGRGLAASTAVPAPARDTGGFTIGLRRLDLAPYLATPAIVVRHGARIVTSEFHRWGEEPGAGITRAVAEYLVAAPAILAVDAAPWPVRVQHDYLVQLHLFRLEGVAPEESTATEGEVHVVASWEITRPGDGALLARGQSDRREAGWRVGDYRGLVTLLETGLKGLAGDLTVCLARLGPAMPADTAAIGRAVVCGTR
jgi:uncharacterized lipoprotein YmbA